MNDTALAPDCIAFLGTERIGRGTPSEILPAVKAALDADGTVPVLVFDAVTSELAELDLHGTLAEALARLPHQAAPTASASAPVAAPAPRAPGRPKLGVVGREVTLLPRHWEWLATQPGGASVTLRKLVERARKESVDADRARQARDATYRFMYAMAGDEAGFEDASRALFAGDRERFEAALGDWPADVRAHVLELAEGAL